MSNNFKPDGGNGNGYNGRNTWGTNDQWQNNPAQKTYAQPGQNPRGYNPPSNNAGPGFNNYQTNTNQNPLYQTNTNQNLLYQPEMRCNPNYQVPTYQGGPMPTNTVHGQGLGNNQYANVQYQNNWGQAPKPTTQNQPIIPRTQTQQTGKLYSYRTPESEYGREKSPRIMGRPKSPRDPNNYNTKKVTGTFDLESMTNEQADMYFQQIDQDMRQKPKGPPKKPDSAPKVHANFNAADYFFDEPFEKDKVVCDQDWLNQSTLDNYFPTNPAPSDKKSKREHADVFQSGLFEAKIPTYKPRKTEDDKPVVDRYAIKEVSEDEDSFNFSDDQ
jgi:hypothetical protein